MANKLVEIIDTNVVKYGDREAYRFCWRKQGDWLSTSWNEFGVQVEVASSALCRLGLLEKDAIAICSPNTPQILITELGAFRNRLVCVPLYSSTSQTQMDFILKDSGARFLFVGDKHQYRLAAQFNRDNPGVLKAIVIFKNDGLSLDEDDSVSISWDDFVRLGMSADENVRSEVRSRMSRGLPEDMATLIYTSGTTGEPKGVCITHSNYDATIEAHIDLLKTVSDKDLSMSFLPMSHILEKAWCFYCLTRGLRIAFNYDPRMVQDTLQEVHPNIMTCVPRFWEKVYAGIREKIAGMNGLQRLAVARALKVGRKRNMHYRRLGLKVPKLLEKEYSFWDSRLFSKVRMAVGIPCPNIFPTAGAPLSDRICEFMRTIGIDIIYGYGLSETTATVSCFPEVGWKIGTVGRPLDHVRVKIDRNGEILVKGPTVTPGYYNNPKANEEAFTSDGWFRTGDAGYLTPEGDLVLTERVKDLFKTSNGKYIAPQMLESRLAENKFIDEVAVIGDRRKYVTALVVPNLSQLRKTAPSLGVNTDDSGELTRNPDINRFMMLQVNEAQQGVSEYEKIKKIYLLPNHFSLENGEVTNTMKVRRSVVAKRYAAEIESMYDEHPE